MSLCDVNRQHNVTMCFAISLSSLKVYDDMASLLAYPHFILCVDWI